MFSEGPGLVSVVTHQQKVFRQLHPRLPEAWIGVVLYSSCFSGRLVDGRDWIWFIWCLRTMM